MITQDVDNNIETSSPTENELGETRNKHQWNNSDNNEFYSKIQPEEMRAFAERGGLSTCCDMKLLENYWSNASSILEVGAGYGRIIGYLLSHDYKGRITAIEKSALLFGHLKKLYGGKAMLLQSDIRNSHNIDETFDLILFAWSGIQDFSPIEQQRVIQRLARLLNKDGNLILDTIPSNIAPLGSERSDTQDAHKLKFNNTTAYIYNISQEQIDFYGIVAGLKTVKHTTYTTDTGRKRVFHILSS